MATFFGTDKNDILTGTNDTDVLDGGKGADQMAGGKKYDYYYVDNAKDVVIELANEGKDKVISAISYTLTDNVEDLLLGNNAVSGIGNDLDNEISGSIANNILDGGIGADTLMGSTGNDTYIVDNAGDDVVEQDGQGTDLVKSSVTHALSAWVENLTLTGANNINAFGNDLDNVITGNSGNNFINGLMGADKMIGGKGNDTYAVENAGDKVVEAVGQGYDTVVSTVDFSLKDSGANVEELQLVGNATVGTGNALDNVITGNGFENHLDGGLGKDTLAGGKGNDYYWVDNLKDVVVENAGEGTLDWVNTSVSVAKLWDNVEVLIMTGNGALNATGNDLDNSIVGTIGKNVIDGGIGKDFMAGDKGDDTYIVDNFDDQIQENQKGGTDLVKSSVTYTLTDNIENLTLTGTSNISATGNELNNILTGNDGNNTLTGGLGNDTMIGGKGGDNYYVNGSGDKVVESVTNANGGGKDSVYSSIDFSLAALGNVENLFLSFMSNAKKATGNALDNTLEGNNEQNIIDGGKGADAMSGFGGWDKYYVDNAGDTVTESAGEGTDTVVSTIALANAFAEVENYEFKTSAAVHFDANGLNNRVDGGSGKDEIYGLGGNDYLFGNGGSDRLFGGSGNDVLDGGTGNDEMTGGSGNDTYYVDNIKDTVVESFAAGKEWVNSTVSINLLFDNVENAKLDGSANLNLTGNALDNVLEGNDGKNVIIGGVGKDEIIGRGGNDTLTGGAGSDTFDFDLDPKEMANDGHDTIKDFVKAEDVLQFYGVDDVDNNGMTNLADLISSISSVVDKGAGKDVDVTFDNGGVITFTGIGTGSVDSITDLVSNAAQIQVN